MQSFLPHSQPQIISAMHFTICREFSSPISWPMLEYSLVCSLVLLEGFGVRKEGFISLQHQQNNSSKGPLLRGIQANPSSSRIEGEGGHRLPLLAPPFPSSLPLKPRSSCKAFKVRMILPSPLEPLFFNFLCSYAMSKPHLSCKGEV